MGNRKIVICEWKLTDRGAFSKDSLKNKVELEYAINGFYNEKLAPNNIEIFRREKNVIITESGCYGAFFEEDLQKV